jgi:hypothetical protein
MCVEFTESQTQLTYAQIDAFGARLQLKLPTEYRDFLFRTNGGRPRPAVFEFSAEKGRIEDSSVQYFLAIHDRKFGSLEKKIAAFKIRTRRIPHELIPIAHDEFGNYICLAIGGKQAGAVYFWDHENESPVENQPWWKNVHLITPSLQSFLDSLH